MIVNSISFWLFFLSVFVLYYSVCKKSRQAQNLLLLIASYVFYGIAEWKMIPLLLLATALYYILGIWIKDNIQKNPRRASHLTTFSVVVGVGILFYFKYLNFLIGEFISLFNSIGIHTNAETLKIVMPLGISFFTFKLISYTVEVHRENIEPCKDPIAFGTFVAFFPTIMSGPIDRPGEFLPQLKSNRYFTYENGAEGAIRIIWGMFLKMCIADRISGYTTAIFNNIPQHNASSIIIASVLYAFELYADFSGYSEMAIGVSQLLGLKIRENFKRPFLSQNMAEFWRRWHMSLTSWLTDYVFMPLNISFRAIGKWGLYLATVLNLVIVGFWHGANWTYGLFGLYHGILLVLVTSLDKRRKSLEKKYNLKNKAYYKYPRIVLTFSLVTIGLMIFRSSDIAEFIAVLKQLGSGFDVPFMEPMTFAYGVLFLAVLIFKEIKDEQGQNTHFFHSKNVVIRLLSISLMIIIILLMGVLNGSNSFIYYQF